SFVQSTCSARSISIRATTIRNTAQDVDVLVDTSVWSLAYRRSRLPPHPAAVELALLIREGRAFLIGPVRQEILSGIREEVQFNLVRDTLRAFPDLFISISDYEEAATFFNRCRSRGIQGSHIDF